MKNKKLLTEDTVVSTVMSNLGLIKSLEKKGIKVIRTNVGDRHVYEEIKRGGYKLGGEQSGHIIFSSYATTGDGILTSLKIMEIMLSEKMKLSELTADFKTYPQTLINVAVKDKDKIMASEFVYTAVKRAKDTLGERGRILLRASGTENVIRVMVEAEREELCKSTAESLAKTVEENQ